MPLSQLSLQERQQGIVAGRVRNVEIIHRPLETVLKGQEVCKVFIHNGLMGVMVYVLMVIGVDSKHR